MILHRVSQPHTLGIVDLDGSREVYVAVCGTPEHLRQRHVLGPEGGGELEGVAGTFLGYKTLTCHDSPFRVFPSVFLAVILQERITGDHGWHIKVIGA